MIAPVHEVREVRGFPLHSTRARILRHTEITDFTDLYARGAQCQTTDFTDYTDRETHQ